MDYRTTLLDLRQKVLMNLSHYGDGLGVHEARGTKYKKRGKERGTKIASIRN